MVFRALSAHVLLDDGPHGERLPVTRIDTATTLAYHA